MSATLRTSVFGDQSFETIWSHASGMHIGILTKGGYVYAGSGLPVTDKAHLLMCFPAGAELDAALKWFDHKDERPKEDSGPPKRKIYYEASDQSYRYVDTDLPVTEHGDLFVAFQDSPTLNHAMAWLTRQAQKAPVAHLNEGPDDKILSLVAEASTGGVTVDEMSKALKFSPANVVQIMEAMLKRQQLAFYNKRFYLPRYAPKPKGEEG